MMRDVQWAYRESHVGALDSPLELENKNFGGTTGLNPCVDGLQVCF
jgi:hypothetical protein